jgi:3-hydroxyacyl-[acyl-carrier-protein] dehydratase
MTTETTTLQSADIAAILKSLPHRYPFLLVDRIKDIVGHDSCVGIKNVTANEPQFQGHFPEQPVFPGVLIIEAMAQTAGVISILAAGGKRPKAVLFTTIDECKFRKPVVPGDQLELHMTRLKAKRNMSWYKGEAKVDGQMVAEAIVGAMIISADE